MTPIRARLARGTQLVRCWLVGHDWLRAYSPGHLRLRCQSCGYESPGLRGPVAHVEPPVVRRRKLRAPKVAALRVVKRRTA